MKEVCAAAASARVGGREKRRESKSSAATKSSCSRGDGGCGVEYVACADSVLVGLADWGSDGWIFAGGSMFAWLEELNDSVSDESSEGEGKGVGSRPLRSRSFRTSFAVGRAARRASWFRIHLRICTCSRKWGTSR